MTTSRQWSLAHLLSSGGFSFIAIAVLQIIAVPVPASAHSPRDQAQAVAEAPRFAAPSVLRERSKPRKKGDPTATRGEPSPMFLVSPRPPGMNIAKRLTR
jgi:hypothetical protein